MPEEEEAEAEVELGTPRAPACSGGRGGHHINRTLLILSLFILQSKALLVAISASLRPFFRLIKFSP